MVGYTVKLESVFMSLVFLARDRHLGKCDEKRNFIDGRGGEISIGGLSPTMLEIELVR